MASTAVVGGVIRLHQGIVGFELLVAHMHAEIFGDAAQLIECGSPDCHGLVSLWSCPLQRALRCDTDEFSDQACVAEIARRHFPGDARPSG